MSEFDTFSENKTAKVIYANGELRIAGPSFLFDTVVCLDHKTYLTKVDDASMDKPVVIVGPAMLFRNEANEYAVAYSLVMGKDNHSDLRSAYNRNTTDRSWREINKGFVLSNGVFATRRQTFPILEHFFFVYETGFTYEEIQNAYPDVCSLHSQVYSNNVPWKYIRKFIMDCTAKGLGFAPPVTLPLTEPEKEVLNDDAAKTE